MLLTHLSLQRVGQRHWIGLAFGVAIGIVIAILVAPVVWGMLG